MNHFTSFLPPSITLVAGALAAALLSAGCGSAATPVPTSTAAAVAGPADMHCTMNGVELKQAIGMCVVPGGSTSSALSNYDAGPSGAAGASGASAGGADGSADAGDDGGNGGGSDFGETLYNAEGEDDDCKYHVSWKSTAVKENVGVSFDVTLIRRFDGAPATGADIQLEAFLDPTHPTPSLLIPNEESAGGHYRIGPVLFDKPGQWTARFHFYEMCSDSADSPHGHAAFYLSVP